MPLLKPPATPSGNGGNANPAPSTPAPSAPSTQAPSGNPQQIARSMLSSYGWNDSQFSCLVSLWNKESEWNPSAVNKSSGAYGIPQSLPGSKMASAGADWRTNPATQIRWGLGYIQGRYGTPLALFRRKFEPGAFACALVDGDRAVSRALIRFV